MFPTLFDSAWIGLDGALRFTVPSYFVALMLGYLGAVWISYREALRIGVDRQRFLDFAIWMLIVGVLGGRIAHVLVDGFFWDYVHLCTDPFLVDGEALKGGAACVSNAQCLAAQQAGANIGSICSPDDGLCYPQRDCFRWLKFWAGGLTVYGSLVACVVVGYLYLKRHGMPVRAILDMGGYGIPFGLFLGRLGCLAGGCCFGEVCEVEWLGVRFPTGTMPYQEHYDHHFDALDAQWRAGVEASLPVWPTQLISSAYNFVIFVVAYFVVRPRKRFHGQVILTSALLYAACRFGIEFLRADPRGGVLGLSTSQLIALATVVVSGWVLWRMRRA